MNLTDLALSGPLLVAVLLALVAGTVSFASPCCLPLVPGYIGYLAGLVGSETAAAAEVNRSVRRRVGAAAVLFVAGFSVVFAAGVFVVLGLSDLLVANERLLQQVGGAVTIVMGMVFLGFIPALQREVRIHRLPRGGLAGAPVLGAVYGLGWTPCLGPTLTGVIALASGTQIGPATTRGLVLVLAYCAGLGIPFVPVALGTQWAVRAVGWMRRNVRALQVCGGAMLVVLGVLLVSGLWGEFIAWLRVPVAGYGLPV